MYINTWNSCTTHIHTHTYMRAHTIHACPLDFCVFITFSQLIILIHTSALNLSPFSFSELSLLLWIFHVDPFSSRHSWKWSPSWSFVLSKSREEMMEEGRMNVPRKDCLEFCHGTAISDPFRFVCLSVITYHRMKLCVPLCFASFLSFV